MSRQAAPRVLAALVLVALLAGCSGGAPAGEPIPGARPGLTLPAPEDRPEAPSSSAPLLGDEDTQVAIQDFSGDVVVLNFWASWCGPCRAEQPELNEVHDEFAGSEVTFLGVNIQDSVPNAQAHEREFAIPYPSIFDPSNAYAAAFKGVGPRSIPSTVVIDRAGRVAVQLFGTTNASELKAVIAPLLAEPLTATPLDGDG